MKKLPQTINIKLKVWRQQGPEDKGHFETLAAKNISVHMSFIEMLDCGRKSETSSETVTWY